MPSIHARTCHICEANCGILVELEGRKVLSVKGNPDHVLSEGYICPKATAIPDLQDDPDRLRRPIKRVGDTWEEIDWDTAFAEIGEKCAKIMATPKTAALYMGNPNTHNYSTATQIKGLHKALELRGMYSASTLDQLPHMIAQKWVYGHNALYPVADIDRTHYMLCVGGNPLASNGSLWTVPNVRGRIKRLQARGGKFAVIDPRKTETAKAADAHYFITPGTDTALFLGLLLAMDEAGLVNPGRLEDMLDEGWAQAWDIFRSFDLKALSDYCGISLTDLRAIAAELGGEKPAIVYGRMGVSVATFGTLNHYLIQMINIAGGNLDREGGVMFGLPAIDHVEHKGTGPYGRFTSRVGGSPEVLGELPAVEIAQEITTEGEGQIGAFFTIAGNPVLAAPGGTQLDAALETLDLMVSIDMYITGTTRHADYILPPCGPLEKDHYPLFLAPMAVRNFAAYGAPAFPMEDGAKSDWEIVAGLSKAIAAATGKEHVKMPNPRDALSHMLSLSEYDITLEQLENAPNGIDLGELKPMLPERLRTPDKKINCAPELCIDDIERFRAALGTAKPNGLTLIGRRHVRDNNTWLHNSHRLLKGPNRCTLMIHPKDAIARNMADGDMAKVYNHVGEVELAAEVSEDVMPGVVSIPHGYGHARKGIKLSVAAGNPGVSINDLTDPALTDPLSGNAVLNGVPVSVERA